MASRRGGAWLFDNSQARTGTENQPLLPSPDFDDNLHHDGCHPPHSRSETCPANPHAHLPVYTTIHDIRKEVIAAIDDPYSLEQLRDPRMNLSLVRPLVDKFYEANDVSTIYCLLVNRHKFQREQARQPHQQSIAATRALLCELLATRILRRFHEDNSGSEGLLLLAQILVEGFDPFQAAPSEVLRDFRSQSWSIQKRNGYMKKLPALEIAIISESKTFLTSSACQMVVNAIYEGIVTYTPTSFIDILPDHYKQQPITLYDPRKAPLFNQYRLVVPRTRNILEVCQFIVLLALYMLLMVDPHPEDFGITECTFIIYTLGWTLDQFASILEHGWSVYTQNLWSFLDVTFSGIFGAYLVIRMHGWRTGEIETAQQAMNFLALGAPVLVPRLAFNLMSEHMLFVSLRAMMKDFTVLTALALWCFAGFLLAMHWLHKGFTEPITIAMWMIWIWFGLDGTGIKNSVDFHWLLGPTLMVTFAFLGNTLFLTILVSMLSSTFSAIVSNATAEIMFRRAVLTLEGVKSDAIFSYQPPFNILAILILLPLKMVLTPRWFHKINVASIRVLNAPLLLIVALLERKMLWAGEKRKRAVERMPKPESRAGFWKFSRSFSIHGDIQAVFEAGSSQSEEASTSEEDLSRRGVEDIFAREFGEAADKSKKGEGKSRRDSMAPFEESEGQKHDPAISERLEALEEATRRIERMVGKLCEESINKENDNSGSTEVAGILAQWGTADPHR